MPYDGCITRPKPLVKQCTASSQSHRKSTDARFGSEVFDRQIGRIQDSGLEDVGLPGRAVAHSKAF